MRYLLNISTHPQDLVIAGEAWSGAVSLLEETGFDGFELYPVGEYDFRTVPPQLIGGIHLRFFVMLRQIWQNDRSALLRIFGDEETVRHYYGGADRETVISCYRRQLDLAVHFNVPYVVFHPVHYELEYVFNWQPPWDWREMVDLSAEVINEVVRQTSYRGWILFENLWWPGNFRLDGVDEIERLFSQVTYPRCGLVLDTGHILNKNQRLRNEREAIAYLLSEVERLGGYRRLVKAVHLCKSLSAESVAAGQACSEPYAGAETFWERFSIAAGHVRDIDRHDAFTDTMLQELFRLVQPDTTVFEFSFASRQEWLGKIRLQQRALGGLFRASENRKGVVP